MAKGRREQVGRVKFLLDECLSHTYVADFVARGYPDVVHPIHVGLRRLRDDLLLKKAIAQKVTFVPGSSYYAYQDVHNAIRLSFTQPTPEQIVEAIRRLGNAVKEMELAQT